MKRISATKFGVVEDPCRPTPKEAYGCRIYFTTACAALGAAMAGYDNAYIGGTISLPSFQDTFGITPKTQAHMSSNIVSTLVAGCFVGSLIAYFVIEKWGRKKGLSVSAAMALLGGILQTVSIGQIALLYAGRAITGIGIGIVATTIPVYVSEVAPPSIRGRLVGIADICVMLAQVLGYWINYGVKIHMKPSLTQWRIPVAIQLVAPGLMILAIPTMVESPRWSVARGRNEKACNDLAWIRHLPKDHEYVQWELGEMQARATEINAVATGEWNVVKALWNDLNARGMRRRLILACLARVMHSMTGVAALSLYSPLIFRSIGFNKPNDDLLFTGIFGAVKVVATSIFLFFFIDSWGRRKTVLAGSSIIVACLFYLGAFMHISHSFDRAASLDAAAICALVVVYLFTAAYAFSWAAFPVIFTSEIFPTRLRALAMTIVSIVQWAMYFVVAYSIPHMVKNIKYGTFYFFGAVTLVSTVTVFAVFPETKGFPLEKMDLIFKGSRWARKARSEGERLLMEVSRVDSMEQVLEKDKNGPRTAEQSISGGSDM